MRRLITASALAVALAATLVVGAALVGAPAPAEAQLGPTSSEPAQDLRSDKITGPRYEDSTPGRAAGLPMAAAGVAAFAVVLVLVVRSRRRRHPAAATAAPPPG